MITAILDASCGVAAKILPVSGATAPLWVTITLGIAAVVGTIAGAWGGQWIAARRDDRRWEREMAREDVRWERELQRLEAQVNLEREKVWSNVRMDSLNEVLDVFTQWFGKLDAAFDAIRDGKPVAEDVLVDSDSFYETLNRMRRRLPLVVSGGMESSVLDAMSEFLAVARFFETRDHAQFQSKHPVDRLWDCYYDLINRMKEELGQELLSFSKEEARAEARRALR